MISKKVMQCFACLTGLFLISFVCSGAVFRDGAWHQVLASILVLITSEFVILSVMWWLVDFEEKAERGVFMGAFFVVSSALVFGFCIASGLATSDYPKTVCFVIAAGSAICLALEYELDGIWRSEKGHTLDNVERRPL